VTTLTSTIDFEFSQSSLPFPFSLFSLTPVTGTESCSQPMSLRFSTESKSGEETNASTLVADLVITIGIGIGASSVVGNFDIDFDSTSPLGSGSDLNSASIDSPTVSLRFGFCFSKRVPFSCWSPAVLPFPFPFSFPFPFPFPVLEFVRVNKPFGGMCAGGGKRQIGKGRRQREQDGVADVEVDADVNADVDVDVDVEADAAADEDVRADPDVDRDKDEDV